MKALDGMMRRRLMIKDDFATLDYQFSLNPQQDEWVDKLNRLPQDERNLFIKYIECSNHYSELAREMRVSTQVVKDKIQIIREKLLNNNIL